MTTVKARFDGRVFVPEEPVDLPIGFILEIPIVVPQAATSEKRPLAELLEKLERLPADEDWPADGAAQHDHYLYGAEKRP